MRTLPLLGMIACMPGPSAQTLVDELRVIAVVAEPPEARPGEAIDAEVIVADPLAVGADVAIWLCTPSGQGACLEQGSPLQQRLAIGRLEGDRLSAQLQVADAWGALAVDEPLPIPAWILACAPGLCPQLEVLRIASGAGAADPQLEALLASPLEWVAELPIEGVSLASKQLAVSTRPPGDRNSNPVLTVEGELSSEPSAELTLEVSVTDQEEVAEVVGLSTGGGFGLPAFEVLDGRAQMRWFAPEVPSEVRLYTVATDGVGGTAVWSGDATVR